MLHNNLFPDDHWINNLVTDSFFSNTYFVSLNIIRIWFKKSIDSQDFLDINKYKERLIKFATKNKNIYTIIYYNGLLSTKYELKRYKNIMKKNINIIIKDFNDINIEKYEIFNFYIDYNKLLNKHTEYNISLKKFLLLESDKDNLLGLKIDIVRNILLFIKHDYFEHKNSFLCLDFDTDYIVTDNYIYVNEFGLYCLQNKQYNNYNLFLNGIMGITNYHNKILYYSFILLKRYFYLKDYTFNELSNYKTFFSADGIKLNEFISTYFMLHNIILYRYDFNVIEKNISIYKEHFFTNISINNDKKNVYLKHNIKFLKQKMNFLYFSCFSEILCNIYTIHKKNTEYNIREQDLILRELSKNKFYDNLNIKLKFYEDDSRSWLI